MKNNFWENLRKRKKPIYALPPMAGVTDSAFRQVCKKYGADVVYSEMVSATALAYGSKKTLELLEFSKKERPFVIQLFGAKPEHFASAAKFITNKIKPDGIDINFGCPVKKVAKQGAGAILMNDLELSYKIIKAVLDNTDLPVSVKCRSRVGEVTAIDFFKKIKKLDVSAAMIHGRSVSQGHAGEVDWRMIRNARKYFNGVILANGGVKDKLTSDELILKAKADGVGVAQASLGRPWIFEDVKNKKIKQKTKKEIFKIAKDHFKLAVKLKGDVGAMEMRKHLCWYVKGLPNANELRDKLVRVKNFDEVRDILK